MLFFLPQLLIASLALALIRIYTEFLDPLAVGQVMLLLSSLALVQSFFASALAQSVFYFASKQGGSLLLVKFAKSINVLRAAAAVVVASAVLVVLLPAKLNLEIPLFMVGGILAAFGLVFDVYRSALITIVNAEGRYGTYNALISADAILAFGASAAVLSMQPTVSGFLLSYGLARGFSYLLTSTAVGRSAQTVGADTPPAVQEIIRGSLPFSFMGILGWCTSHLDRFIVAFTVGTVSAGHYAVAGSLVARPYGVLTSALTVRHKPDLFKLENSINAIASNAFLRWIGTAAALAITGIACFFVVANTRAIELLVGPMAPMISDLLILFSLAFTLTTLTHPIENTYLSYGRSKNLLWIQIAYLPITLALLGSRLITSK